MMDRKLLVAIGMTLSICFYSLSCSDYKDVSLVDTIEIFYFYDNVCASCDDEEKFIELFNNKIGDIKDDHPTTINMTNVYSTGGMEALERVCASYAVDPADIKFPVLMLGGKVYSSEAVIENNLREAYLVACEDLFTNKKPFDPQEKKYDEDIFEDIELDNDTISLVYFYRLVCEDCIKLEPFLIDLPTDINSGDQKKELNIIRLNTRSGINSKRIMSMFEAYNVPDQDRVVPIIFLADSYIAGYENIINKLDGELESNYTSTFAWPIT